MCDTLCVVDGSRLLFAKNSDRPVGEVQLVEHWPRRPPSLAALHTQYLDLDDRGAHACVGSRPAWLWGFEHGINEYGVAIGNEKIWTTDDPHRRPKGLLGMDLVRLGLEQAQTADDALAVMTALLEEYGQGGTGEKDADEPYDNAFLVADPARAWIIETSNKRWAARRVQHGGAAISNRVSLGTNWIRASADVAPGTDVQSWRAPDRSTERADSRLAATSACVSTSTPSTLRVETVVAALRDHDSGVCMHAHDIQKVTTASMVCEVHTDDRMPRRAWFAPASPCVSVYVPVFPPDVPAALGDPAVWRRFDRLRERADADPTAHEVIRSVLDPVEAELWDEAERHWRAGAVDPAWSGEAWLKVAAALDSLG